MRVIMRKKCLKSETKNVGLSLKVVVVNKEGYQKFDYAFIQ